MLADPTGAPCCPRPHLSQEELTSAQEQLEAALKAAAAAAAGSAAAAGGLGAEAAAKLTEQVKDRLCHVGRRLGRRPGQLSSVWGSLLICC
jgi:hypothetical protein